MKAFINLEVFVVEDASLEDLFLARNQLKVMDDGYQEFHCPTPDWILDKLNSINAAVNHRMESQLKAQLRAAKARRSALRTADEKRRDLDADIADLEKRLGQ